MAMEARRLESVPLGPVGLAEAERVFGLDAASRLLDDLLPPWVQDLDPLVEAIESGRPAGAPADWLPGAVIRLPFSSRLCRGGVVCAQALMAIADTAMTLACAAAWNGYRPMSAVDQTTHFLRPVNFDVLADARIIRAGRATSFGRVTLASAVDRRPVGMVSSVYAMVP
jgi:acyl-coenzyme A thioesterase PaaI-like protein